MRRKEFLWVTAGMAAGMATAAQRPVHSHFFNTPARPDRYLRNLLDMEGMEVVREPSLHGGRSIEMRIRFSETHRMGRLVWDLAARRVSRARFSLFNPNPARIPLALDVRFFDMDRRSWRLRNAHGHSPLKPDWQTIDFSLRGETVVTQGREEVDAGRLEGVFSRIQLSFSLPGEQRIPAQPVRLYLDGIELF